MKEFSSIESFKHAVANVRRYCGDKALPLPTIDYVGTVKLHGTNAGVCITHNDVRAQKRSAVINIGNDNYGFAVFVKKNETAFRAMAEAYFGRTLKKLDDITFFGEWCGSNIQKGVGLANLAKHFVIFNAWEQRDGYKRIERITENCVSQWFESLNAEGIYFIDQIPTYKITIDFTDPTLVTEELSNLTLAVEKSCPWTVFHGSDGIGEGIVWQPADAEMAENVDLWFKTKGLEHKKAGGDTTGKIAADPKSVAGAKAFAEEVLPEWRLEQGITYLKDNGFALMPESTGKYLQWICQDVLKEESDTLVASELTWKQVQGQVTQMARQYYLTEIKKTV